MAGRCLPQVLLQTSEGIINLFVNGQNYTDNQIPGSEVLEATKVLANLASLEEVSVFNVPGTPQDSTLNFTPE